jgi:MYXO-CTERM domain-containing protein
MRFRTVALAAGLSVGLTQNTDAFAPHKGADRPFVANGLAPRAHRNATFITTTLAQHGLDGWRAIWDRDTDIPTRLWGEPIAAPGAMANPAVAESVARTFLAEHLSLLAPGAQITDFVLVSNQLGGFGDVRSVGFEQRLGGLRVLGGAINFAFKHDRLIMVGSTALPNVSVVAPKLAFEPARVSAAATAWLATTGRATTVASLGDRVIVPIVRPRTKTGLDIRYHIADTVAVVDAADSGRWNVWVSADTGLPVARASTVMYASSGTVNFDVPDRYPLSTRHPQPASNDTHTVNGAATISNATGVVTWATTTAATVAPGLTGPLVAITNKAGALVTSSLSLPVGGAVTWSEATVPTSDSQLDAFVYASQAKAFAKKIYNPNLAWLGNQISVNVNEQQTCNAFSTGDDIHFFISNTMCENTGRIADVVYHEFGHSLHNNSIIPGVGAFDSSLSEGLADTNATSMTLDHGLGRGFFFNDNPLRDLDPVGIEKKWPQDADGEPHDEGEIIGETIWDLRKALNAKYGDAAGFTATEKIFYGIMQRAHDIPTSTYAEALVADDDDGNLMNGTPNQCEINAAFGLHGLADPSVTIGLAPPTRTAFTISLDVKPPTQSACPPPGITAVQITWKPRAGGSAGGMVAMTQSGNTWSGDIPTQPDGTVVQYQVTVTLADASTAVFPDNKADPFYEFYVGNVTVIKCWDFESGAADWTHTGNPDEWEAAIPKGLGGDPAMAHGGTMAFGIDLGNAGNGDGLYPANVTTSAVSADVDVTGYSNVRLQYYRWLGVEDGAYDHATISANDMVLWTNLASPGMPTGGAEVNHVDKEWRFQDVDLTGTVKDNKVNVKFGLTSDQGLELGGWTVDDVCIVAAAASSGTCGDGIVQEGEMCDDGNTTDGDGCSSTCQIEQAHEAGCCSSSTSPVGAAGLGAIVLGMVLRRRRRQ